MTGHRTISNLRGPLRDHHRAENVASPPRAQELYKKLDELTLDTWIELYELMTPEKMTDVG